MFCLRNKAEHQSLQLPLTEQEAQPAFVYVTEVPCPAKATQRPLGNGNPLASSSHILCSGHPSRTERAGRAQADAGARHGGEVMSASRGASVPALVTLSCHSFPPTKGEACRKDRLDTLQFGVAIFPHCAFNSSNNPSAHDSNIVNICGHTTGRRKKK